MEFDDSGGDGRQEWGRFGRIELQNLLVEGSFAGVVIGNGPVSGGVADEPWRAIAIEVEFLLFG